MFNADYKNPILSFNEFHEVSDKDMPQDGEYCLLELKNGDYTAGGWHPSGKGNTAKGMFIRGTFSGFLLGLHLEKSEKQ